MWSQYLREKSYESISRRSVPDRQVHHGDNDVLSGGRYVEWGPSEGEGERVLARVGGFFRVPAGVGHRDVNPSDDEQDYVL